MKIGDTVKLKEEFVNPLLYKSAQGCLWVGLVLGFADGLVEVYWNEDFPCEGEYTEDLDVIN